MLEKRRGGGGGGLVENMQSLVGVSIVDYISSGQGFSIIENDTTLSLLYKHLNFISKSLHISLDSLW